jgi:transposase
MPYGLLAIALQAQRSFVEEARPRAHAWFPPSYSPDFNPIVGVSEQR